jgi:hypothetical protein
MWQEQNSGSRATSFPGSFLFAPQEERAWERGWLTSSWKFEKVEILQISRIYGLYTNKRMLLDKVL